jgi:hypothetical protein
MEPKMQAKHVHVPNALIILRLLLVPQLKLVAIVWPTFMEMPEPLMAHAKLAQITVPLMLSHPLIPLPLTTAHVRRTSMDQMPQLVAQSAVEEPLLVDL